MKTLLCHGQPSWKFASNRVEAAVTRMGGQLAPVRFHLPHAVIEPFAIAPWAEEKERGALPPLLQALRGDFFCEFFGANAKSYRGEQHPPHGETAHAPWRFESLRSTGQDTTLHLSLETRIRKGRVDKFLELRKGETAIYCRHVITGEAGPVNPGHHAILKFPETPDAGVISTSPILFGQNFPTPFEQPAERGYSSLKPGGTFSRLDRVPSADGTMADVSRYPARRGFEDLLMVVHESRPDFAWTAVTFPKERYVWFALKDPRFLRSTVFWISNGGRHYPPWNGRHVNIMGLEDVTAYSNYGLAESARPNPVNRRGYATALSLRKGRPLAIHYIMAVAAIPRGFDRVRSIARADGRVILTSGKGHRVSAAVDPSFLQANL